MLVLCYRGTPRCEPSIERQHTPLARRSWFKQGCPTTWSSKSLSANRARVVDKALAVQSKPLPSTPSRVGVTITSGLYCMNDWALASWNSSGIFTSRPLDDWQAEAGSCACTDSSGFCHHAPSDPDANIEGLPYLKTLDG